MGSAAGSAGRTGLVPGPVRNRRVSLAWPRLPAAAEVAIVAAGYFGYALVRLAVRASRPAAVAHAAGQTPAETRQRPSPAATRTNPDFHALATIPPGCNG